MKARTGRWHGRTLATTAMIAMLAAACGGAQESGDGSAGAATAEGGSETEAQAGGDASFGSVEDAGGMEELVSCAQDEGELMLYTGIGESASRGWAEEFGEEFGIEVEVFRDGSQDLYGRWSQEVRAGRHEADAVVINAYQHLSEAVSEGRLAAYETEHVDKFPDDLFPEGSELGQYVTPLQLTVTAVAVNSDLISDETRAMLQEDPLGALLEGPEFEQGVSVNTPTGGGATGTFLSIVEEMDQYGIEYLEQLAELPLYRYESGIPETEALVAGEFAASFRVGDTILVRQVLEGAPIEFYYPKPEATGVLWMLATPTETQHPCAARLFREWASSKEGQESLSEHGGGMSTHSDWEDTRGLKEFDWYSPPESVWLGWRTHPAVDSVDKVNEFNDRIMETLGL